MLVELVVVEQRYRAVLEVLEGAPVTEVARRFGVVRQTVHGWLRRYAADGGMVNLADRSSRPGSCPHQMPAAVEARVLALRLAHPGWGPDRIAYQLGREAGRGELAGRVPSRSAVYRALVRHGLVQAAPRRRRRSDYKRWERTRPMALWQMDVMGGVYLSGGPECKVVTGIDDHSRFVVCARLVARATARPVCDALRFALGVHGVPEQVLTDNGKVFTGRFTTGAGAGAPVLFDRICTENGIRHLLTAPYSPTTRKVERLHKTMRTEFFDSHDRQWETVEQAQAALDGRVRWSVYGGCPDSEAYRSWEGALMSVMDDGSSSAVEPAGPPRVSGRQLRELLADDLWLDELIDQAGEGGVRLTGEGGFLPELVKAVLERGLAAELTGHLGYEVGDPSGRGSGNSRNGSTPKTVSTEVGPVAVDTPRDPAGSFEPRLVPKGQRRLGGLDEIIISLYAGGMTVRDIGSHLQRTLGTELSHDTISKITDAVLEEVKGWQTRPLDEIYPIVYLDALVVKVRDGHQVRNKAAHLAVGVDLDGVKHVLGIWVQSTEGAAFWAGVCAELANRGCGTS